MAYICVPEPLCASCLEYAPEEQQRNPKPGLHALTLTAGLEVLEEVVDADWSSELPYDLSTQTFSVERKSGRYKGTH